MYVLSVDDVVLPLLFVLDVVTVRVLGPLGFAGSKVTLALVFVRGWLLLPGIGSVLVTGATIILFSYLEQIFDKE